MTDMFFIRFCQLLNVAIGNTADIPGILSVREWSYVYDMANRQALTGIIFSAVEVLPQDKRPPVTLVLKWIALTEQIRTRNANINEMMPAVESLFLKDGFQGCILKGNGVSRYYPEPDLRMSGDIDIWLCGKRQEILTEVAKHAKKVRAVYHHVEGLRLDNIDVEVHFTPSWLNSPFKNLRLQFWLKKQWPTQSANVVQLEDGNVIHAPTTAFNRVYVLLHIYRHFFYEGIGLRQLLDYYYVLKAGFSKEEQKETVAVFKKLGLYKFSRAVLWVLHEVFRLMPEYFIVPPDIATGRVLLDEIIRGGNFGTFSPESRNHLAETRLLRGLRLVRRSMRFFRMSPTEVLWMPCFKIVNWAFYTKNIVRG